MNMEEKIFEVVIPMEEVVEFKNGRKQTVQKKVFPGYLLVRCDMDDESAGTASATPPASPASSARAARARSPRRSSRREVRDVPVRQGRRRRGCRRAQQAQARVRGRRERAGQGRPVRRLLRPDRRDQRRPHEAQGAGQHLRPGDPGRDGLQPGRQAVDRRSSSHIRASREQGTVMAKKKVAAIVKIQIPAGKATPAPPVGTALGPHGVAIMDFVKQYNAATEAQVGTIVPVEITDVRGPHVHVHPEDAADAGAAAPEGRPRQGLDRRRARPSSARSPRPTSKRSPRSRCPTSTPTTSRRPSSRCAAPPARWASRSSEPSDRTTPPTTARPGRPRPAALRPRGRQHHVRQEVRRRRQAVRPRPAVHAHRGARTW